MVINIFRSFTAGGFSGSVTIGIIGKGGFYTVLGLAYQLIQTVVGGGGLFLFVFFRRLGVSGTVAHAVVAKDFVIGGCYFWRGRCCAPCAHGTWAILPIVIVGVGGSLGGSVGFFQTIGVVGAAML